MAPALHRRPLRPQPGRHELAGAGRPELAGAAPSPAVRATRARRRGTRAPGLGGPSSPVPFPPSADGLSPPSARLAPTPAGACAGGLRRLHPRTSTRAGRRRIQRPRRRPAPLHPRASPRTGRRRIQRPLQSLHPRASPRSGRRRIQRPRRRPGSSIPAPDRERMRNERMKMRRKRKEIRREGRRS
ncbi:unnamed protein product [Urochloa humidicola]